MMATLRFSAGVSSWAKQSQARVDAVFKTASQLAVERMSARVPVDTGYCRASLRGSSEAMPTIIPGARPAERRGKHTGVVYQFDPGPIEMLLKSLPKGATFYAGYTASYAARLEYGWTNSGVAYGFVRLTAQEWPAIVKEAVQIVKAEVQG